MQAVIKTGGKQYRVATGDIIQVEKLEADKGQTVELGDVLLVQGDTDTQVGTPTVEGAVVRAKVLTHGRGKKIRVRKFKRRKGYMRVTGHRQDYTQLEVLEIAGA